MRLVQEAVFGAFDGLTSALGVVAGLVVTGASAPHVLAATIGLAVAATTGMAAGQWLSGEDRSVRGTAAMAAATLTGSALPGVPYAFLTGTPAALAAGATVLACATIIGHVRGYRLTYGLLAFVSVVTVILSVLVA